MADLAPNLWFIRIFRAEDQRMMEHTRRDDAIRQNYRDCTWNA